MHPRAACPCRITSLRGRMRSQGCRGPKSRAAGRGGGSPGLTPPGTCASAGRLQGPPSGATSAPDMFRREGREGVACVEPFKRDVEEGGAVTTAIQHSSGGCGRSGGRRDGGDVQRDCTPARLKGRGTRNAGSRAPRLPLPPSPPENPASSRAGPASLQCRPDATPAAPPRAPRCTSGTWQEFPAGSLAAASAAAAQGLAA